MATWHGIIYTVRKRTSHNPHIDPVLCLKHHNYTAIEPNRFSRYLGNEVPEKKTEENFAILRI